MSMHVNVETPTLMVRVTVGGRYNPDVLHDLTNRALTLLAEASGVAFEIEHLRAHLHDPIDAGPDETPADEDESEAA